MQKLQRLYDVRSPEYDELMGRKPSWFIKVGISIVFGFLVLIICAGFFISYPDKVYIRATVVGDPPPVAVFARTSGNINTFVADSVTVQKGQVIAQIGQNVSLNEALYLDSLLDAFSVQRLTGGAVDSMMRSLHFGQIFGPFQPEYMQFYESLSNLHLFLSYANFESDIHKFRNMANSYGMLSGKIKNEMELYDKNLEVARKRVLSDSSLANERVISQQQYENTRSAFADKQIQFLKSIQASITTESQINQYHMQILQLKNDEFKGRRMQETNLLTTMKILKNSIAKWKEDCLITANFDGVVSFSKKWVSNEFVMSNTELVKLVPTYFKRIEVLGFLPIANSGKVAVGQQAIIKLDNYPYQEFGFLHGKLEKISIVPSEGNYQVVLFVDQQLKSSFKTKLHFKNEMQADVEIITKKRSVVARIISKFIKSTS